MTRWLYRALSLPTMAIGLPLLALCNAKVRAGLRLRLRPVDWPEFRSRPLWVHAASGEFEYAKSVIRELKTRHPELPIVVTYFSPTFARAVENFPGVDLALPLPLDLPGPCRTFLDRVQPRALLIARTDFWPEMLAQVRQRRIPIRVFSYTQRESKATWLTRLQLSWIDEVDCASSDDLELLKPLRLPSRLHALGDTRYDQVHYRLRHPKRLSAELKPLAPALVAGSTWSEDERVLLPALAPLLRDGQLKLILVPHEPTPAHVDALKAQLKRLGLTWSLYSEERAWDDRHVLLVDRVGVLAELYLWADLAFVGGSFRRGVHSVMEALGAGALTFVGPKHVNNREAVEFQKVNLEGLPAVVCASSSDDLRTTVTRALADREHLARARERLKAEFERRLGATRRLVDDLESTLWS